MVILGAMTLSDYLASHNVKPAEFAEAVKVKPQTVYRYLDGSRRPKPEKIAAIANYTQNKVQLADWFPEALGSAA